MAPSDRGATTASVRPLSAGRSQALSRTLAYVLRHRPDTIGLTLDGGGWADIGELIERLAASGTRLDRAALDAIVAADDKRRYAVDASGARIRASQGHSVAVELGYVEREPPPQLFHGTATRFMRSIDRSGLLPRGRRHVHLSTTEATARTVGARHGVPVVLVVDAGRMHADGLGFVVADNGVWLTAAVPPRYLSRAVTA